LDADAAAFADIYYRQGQSEKAIGILRLIEDRAQRTIDWYNRLKPSQMNSCSREIVENYSALLRVASVYNNNGNAGKYTEITNRLLAYSQLYFAGNNQSLGGFALRSIAEDAIDTYRIASDTVMRSRQEAIIQQTLGMMQKYCPALLKEYM
jgi:hypothetical protein